MSTNKTASTLARGSRCIDCERRWYYTRPFCPDCGSRDVEPFDLGDGELVARTVVHVTPDDVPSPNTLGIARFEGDVQLIAQLTDPSLEPGDVVRLEGEYALRGNETSLVHGPRLRPVDDS
jgi:uncharacterized OB-fold protein